MRIGFWLRALLEKLREFAVQIGDVVVGQVVQFEPKGALVDVGGKASAFLQSAEVSMQRVDDLEEVASTLLPTVGISRFRMVGGADFGSLFGA